MSLVPGEVALIRFPYSNPPKQKICLCICINDKLYFVISSKAYAWAPADSQIKIFKEELECLEYDSWLDVSKTYYLTLPAGKIEKWVLAKSAITRIKKAVEGQNYLPDRQKKLVLSNL